MKAESDPPEHLDWESLLAHYLKPFLNPYLKITPKVGGLFGVITSYQKKRNNASGIGLFRVPRLRVLMGRLPKTSSKPLPQNHPQCEGLIWSHYFVRKKRNNESWIGPFRAPRFRVLMGTLPETPSIPLTSKSTLKWGVDLESLRRTKKKK